MHKDPNRFKGNCNNCGVPDLLYYYEHVLHGIALCEDCADLPVNKIRKCNSSVNWVKFNGEFYPPNHAKILNKK